VLSCLSGRHAGRVLPARTRVQPRTVRTLDAKAKALLERGGAAALLRDLHGMMVQFKPVLDAAGPGARNRLCAEHPHFGRFAALLSDRTGGVAAGAFDDGFGRK